MKRRISLENNLILSTGSNLNNREELLHNVKNTLANTFLLVEESQIYESKAVDYLNQPDFLNQVLHFTTNFKSPGEVLEETLKIEKLFGRERKIDKGPRTIDIDILFWNLEIIERPNLQIPHPRLFQRSFIVTPLKELKYSYQIQTKFLLPNKFDSDCWIFSSTNLQ